MNAKNNLSVDLVVASKNWKVSAPYVHKVVTETLQQQSKFKNPKHKPVELSVILTSNAKIKAVNRTTRGMDKPTNVLSFPLFPEKRAPLLGLGDIMIALETVKAEALAEKKTFKAHFTHMIVHGTLHLLGYDHETHAQARTMERLEVRILNALGTPNPYAHRQSEKTTGRHAAKKIKNRKTPRA